MQPGNGTRLRISHSFPLMNAQQSSRTASNPRYCATTKEPFNSTKMGTTATSCGKTGSDRQLVWTSRKVILTWCQGPPATRLEPLCLEFNSPAFLSYPTLNEINQLSLGRYSWLVSRTVLKTVRAAVLGVQFFCLPLFLQNKVVAQAIRTRGASNEMYEASNNVSQASAARRGKN